MASLLKLIPGWVWLVLAVAAAFGIQQVRISWLQGDNKELASANADLQIAVDTAQARVESLRNTLELQRQLSADRDEVDKSYQESLQNVQTERDKLAADLASSARRLRVQGTCMRSGSGADNAQPASSADADTFRLTPDAEQAYINLRAGIQQQRNQVIGLQNYIQKVCHK